MSLAIQILGTDYVPLAAIPHITDQFLSADTLADMLCNPENYCDANYETILAAYKVTDTGQTVTIPYACFNDSEFALRCDIVVELERFQSMYQMLGYELGVNGKLAGRLPNWNMDVVLPPALSKAITRCIAIPVGRGSQRANSKMKKLQQLRTAIAQIQSDAFQYGIALDLKNLPGRKVDFLAVLVHLDKSVVMSTATFDSHYAQSLGLRWRQGSKARDAMHLLSLYGLKPAL